MTSLAQLKHIVETLDAPGAIRGGRIYGPFASFDVTALAQGSFTGIGAGDTLIYCFTTLDRDVTLTLGTPEGPRDLWIFFYDPISQWTIRVNGEFTVPPGHMALYQFNGEEWGYRYELPITATEQAIGQFRYHDVFQHGGQDVIIGPTDVWAHVGRFLDMPYVWTILDPITKVDDGAAYEKPYVGDSLLLINDSEWPITLDLTATAQAAIELGPGASGLLAGQVDGTWVLLPLSAPARTETINDGAVTGRKMAGGWEIFDLTVEVQTDTDPQARPRWTIDMLTPVPLGRARWIQVDQHLQEVSVILTEEEFGRDVWLSNSGRGTVHLYTESNLIGSFDTVPPNHALVVEQLPGGSWVSNPRPVRLQREQSYGIANLNNSDFSANDYAILPSDPQFIIIPSSNTLSGATLTLDKDATDPAFQVECSYVIANQAANIFTLQGLNTDGLGTRQIYPGGWVLVSYRSLGHFNVIVDQAVSGGLGTIVTPEKYGAIGDGTTDDTAALTSAFNEADTNGRAVWLDPAKTYLATSNLPAFDSNMIVIGGGTLKAPNGVRCLLFNPAWPAENATVTGLGTTLYQGTQTVTTVALTSTAGLAVGDWIKIGSSTIAVPGPVVNWWFESAQIRAIAANTSLTLDRYLEGHARGLMPSVHANYRLWRVPDGIVRVDVAADADESVNSIFNPAATGRTIFCEDRASKHGAIRVRAKRWWDRLVQCHGIGTVVEASWEALPDITVGGTALGYGVECAAGALGVVAKVVGGGCRHGFTGSTNAVNPYSSAEPYNLGFSFFCGTTKDSVVTGASGAAFDTHEECFGYHLAGRAIRGAPRPDTDALAKAVQNRGFNTTVEVNATGYATNFRERSALTTWTGLGRCLTSYNAIESRDAIDGDHMTIDGIAGNTNVEILLRQPMFIGVQAGTAHGIAINTGFAGRVIVADATWLAFAMSRAVRDNSGICRVQIDGGRVDWLSAATPPFLIDTGAVNRGDGTTGSWQVDGLRVVMLASGQPNGLFEVDSALDANLQYGRLTWDIGALPLRSASSTGGSLLATRLASTDGVSTVSAIVTSGPYAATASEHIPTDSSGGGFDVNLPVAVAGDWVELSDATGSWWTNPVTLVPQAGDVILLANGVTAATLDLDGGGFIRLQYDAGNARWYVANVQGTDQEAAGTSPFIDATGSLAGVASNRSRKLTGNVTAVPIANGWYGTFVNTSGSPKTITPASGSCVILSTAVTQPSVTVPDDGGCFCQGDGTNLLVSGNVS